MDTGRIFSRSLEITWRFKFLWLWGLIMGLTSGGVGSGNFNFNGDGDTFRGGSFAQPPEIAPALIVLAILFLCIIVLVWLVLFFFFRFVARGALVAAVREIEQQGEATLRDSWEQGRRFYARLLGLGFLVNVPLVLLSLIVLALAFIPLLVALPVLSALDVQRPGDTIAGVTLVLSFVAAICVAGLCIWIVMLVIHPLYEFAVRAIVLEDLRVIEGLQQGIRRVRENLGNVIGLYLLLMGVRIGWAIVTAIVTIPIVLLVLVGVFGALQFGLNGVILLGMFLFVPLLVLFGFIEGLFQTFESAAWTEAYLALRPGL